MATFLYNLIIYSPNLQFSDAGVLKAPMINTLINLTVLLLPIILIIILAKFNGAHNKNTFKMDENPYFYVNNDITKPENWKQLSVDQALKGEY